MKATQSIDELSKSLNSALHNDLPENDRSIQPEMVDIVLFLQTWSTNALGFDNFMAGQAFTTATTVVVILGNKACIYFGGDLAYTVDPRNQTFHEVLRYRDLKAQLHAVESYGAILPADQRPIEQ